MTLEHLGVREYTAVDRPDSPGRRLEQSGLNELGAIFVNQNPVLVSGLAERMAKFNLRRHSLMPGVSTPRLNIPPWAAYGGEGQVYRQYGIPMMSFISGPRTLFDPEFGVEAVDFDLFRRQALAFADFIHYVDGLPPRTIAGTDLLYRYLLDLGVVPSGGPI